MNLRIIREPSRDGATIGVAFVDGQFHSFSLEDEVREIVGQPVDRWKVPGETAIPAGRYALRMSFSPRFKRELPEIVNVPGYEGIRIHPLNKATESEGCIGLGLARATATILSSTPAVHDLIERLRAAEAAGLTSWILIENPATT